MGFFENVWRHALRQRAVSQRSFWLVTDGSHQPISKSSLARVWATIAALGPDGQDRGIISLRQAFVSAELYESCGFSKTLVRILCAFRPGDSVAFQLSLTSAMIVRFRHGEVSDQVELARLARLMQPR